MAFKDAGGWKETTRTKVVARDESKNPKEEGKGAEEGDEGAWRRRQRAWCVEREGHSRHKSQEILKRETREHTRDSVEAKQMTEGIKAGDAHGGEGKET